MISIIPVIFANIGFSDLLVIIRNKLGNNA